MGEEMELDFKQLLFIMKKRRKIIISITLICTLISALVSFLILKPQYESKSSIVIGAVQHSSGEAGGYEYSDVMMYQKLVKTFAKIATRGDTVQEAIENYDIREDVKGDQYALKRMGIDEFLSMLKVSEQSDTQIIDIKVQNKNPEKAATMVNAISDSFIRRVNKSFPNVNIQVIDTPKIPEKPVKPNKKLNILIAFVLGLILSMGLSFILELMDNTVKTQDEVEKLLELPVLGGIPSDDVDS